MRFRRPLQVDLQYCLGTFKSCDIPIAERATAKRFQVGRGVEAQNSQEEEVEYEANRS